MNQSRSSREVGAWYEQQARAYLGEQGLKLLDANYNIRGGELDLILKDGQTLVFVEVRYRQRSDFGGAIASINATKVAKLRRTALHYLQHKRLNPDRTLCRFDVIGITGSGTNIQIQWLKNAF